MRCDTYRHALSARGRQAVTRPSAIRRRWPKPKRDAVAIVAAVASSALAVLVEVVSALRYDVTLVRYGPTTRRTLQWA